MKKFLLFAVATAFAGHTMGQSTLQNLKEKHEPKNNGNPVNAVVPIDLPENTVIWTNDFSVPSQWSITNAAGNNDNWVIRNTGANGPLAAQIPTIASPTASNGFALFDSDSLCSGNQNASITLVNPINLSNYNNVVLRFHQQYRRFFDSTFVSVSTNGTTWTNIPFGNYNVANTAFAGTNPQQVNLNISNIAGGQDSVYIRFTFFSVPAMGTDAGCAYAWMIDDISIIEALPNDIVVSQTIVKSRTTFDLYGTYSTNNVNGDSIYVRARFSNNGSSLQPNTRLVVNAVNAAGNTIASQTAVYGSLAPAASDSIEIAGIPVSSLPVGNYTIRTEVISDSTDATPENNRDTAYISVTVDSISQAIRNPRAIASLGTNSFPNFPGAEDDFRCANVLELLDTDTISGVYVKLTQASAGGLIIGHIRPAATIDAPILETDLHVLTVADTTAKVLWLPFLNGLSDRILPAGEYYISVSLFSNTNVNHIRVMDDLSNQKFKATGSSLIFTADDQTWYNNGIAFAIDATFGASNVSVQNLQNDRFEVKQIYPNPTTDMANLEFELKQAGKVEVIITDMRGRAVKVYDFGQLQAGKHTEALNLEAMNSGLYFVEFRSGNAVATQKLIVNR